MPIYFIFNKDKRLEIREGAAPYGIITNKRITRRLLKEHRPVVCKLNPLITALKYQQLYQQTGSMTAVGQQFGVSRVRIHQMLNLLKLDQRIIDYIQNIKEPGQRNYWNEHSLRKLTLLPQQRQFNQFHKLNELLLAKKD